MARKKIENVDVTDDVIESVIEDNRNTEIKATTSKYKTESCKILAYNSKTKELDISFKNYGIRLNGVDNVDGDNVVVKYKGEIGKPNFEYKL